MVHELKIQQQYLDNLVSGMKKAEIRINDRDYQKGDLLRFSYCSTGEVTDHVFEITHIHSGLGLERNYVALSVKIFAACGQ